MAARFSCSRIARTCADRMPLCLSCLKIPSPSFIEDQKVRAKIYCGFKGKGSSQLALIFTCYQMETQHLSLQTKFGQNTLMSQNDVCNNIEWQIGLK